MNAQQFWSRVEKSESCWLWTGSRTSGGYGNLRWMGGYDYAHRVSLRLSGRQIPDGMVVDHLCRNTLCVRPDHLEAVTNRENTLRGAKPYGPLRTRCKRAHDITDQSNVRVDSNGARQCIACDAIRLERRKTKQRTTA